MWHLMPDGRYAVTVTVDGRKDTTKLVSVAREELETIRNFFWKMHICFNPTQILHVDKIRILLGIVFREAKPGRGNSQLLMALFSSGILTRLTIEPMHIKESDVGTINTDLQTWPPQDQNVLKSHNSESRSTLNHQGVFHERDLHAAGAGAARASLRGLHGAGDVGRRPLRPLPLVPLQQGPETQVAQGRLQVRAGCGLCDTWTLS